MARPSDASSGHIDWRFTEWSRGDASDIDGWLVGARERERASQTPYNLITIPAHYGGVGRGCGVGRGLGVTLGVAVGVRVAVGVGVTVAEAVAVGVGVGVGVTEGVGVAVGVAVGVTVGVGVGVGPEGVMLNGPLVEEVF
jgi:hypothetical protein